MFNTILQKSEFPMTVFRKNNQILKLTSGSDVTCRKKLQSNSTTPKTASSVAYPAFKKYPIQKVLSRLCFDKIHVSFIK